MYTSNDFECLFIRYQAESVPADESLQAFCIRNGVPYNLFHKWYKDTRHKVISVRLDGVPPEVPASSASEVSSSVAEPVDSVNYLGEQIEEHFREVREGIKIETVRELKYLGTIGGIKFVDAFYNDTVLVMNSDLFTNIDYEDFYLHFCQHSADMSVAAVPYVVKVPYGVFSLDGLNIKGVVEKPTYSYYANAGIYLIKKHCLDLIPKDEFFNATDFMDRLISIHHKVTHYPISGFWIDIGQHNELARAKEMAKHLKSL